MQRRDILKAVAAAGVAVAAAPIEAATQSRSRPSFPPTDDRNVWLVGDDRPRAPTEMASRLLRLTETNGQVAAADSYLISGAVRQLETSFAKLLGKEDCAFFPTGTMANTVAARVLCGEHSRVLCQADSHLYCDESDAVQRLAGLNLVPLGSGAAAPPLSALQQAFEAAEKGPYPLRIGAVALESPVRRLSGEMIAPVDLSAIAGLCRSHGARLHLDGARLLLAPPSIDTRTYCAAFDTVYVSLYKFLGAPFGAVLAGSKADIDHARDWRHVQGGLLHEGWQAAMLASDGLARFPAEMASAHAIGDALVESLEARGLARRRHAGFASNIILLEMPQDRATRAFERARASGIRLGRWSDGVVPLYVNTTIVRRNVPEYLALFA